MADLAINKTHLILVNAVVKKSDKILISQRSWEETHEPGKWTIPGGKVERTNKEVWNVIEKTLAREVLEETGVKIKKNVKVKEKNSKSKHGKELKVQQLKDIEKQVDVLIEKGKSEGVLTYEEVILFTRKHRLSEEDANELLRCLEKENVDDMKKALDNINKASHKMAEVMYQAASQAGAAGEQPGAGAKKEGDVVEAEFVDEENKREDRK